MEQRAVDYDKRFPVPSETVSTYKFKNGSTLTITKKYIDLLHPRTGAIMKRELKEVSIGGDQDGAFNKEVKSWIMGGYKSRLPQIVKKYMEELT